MNNGKYVFAQITNFLNHNDFNRCVEKYGGNYKVQHFTCWHQLLTMMFGQLANRESLSDLVICLQSQRSKYYHLGMGKGSSKANLAKANENRDARIFEEFSQCLIAEARSICIAEFDLDINGSVYAIDATVVDLCLSVFWWGKFRRNKAAVKLNTILDLKTNIPTFVHITGGMIHEVNSLDLIPFEEGAFYVMDKAYIDFTRFSRIEKARAYYVTRAKQNFQFVRISSKKVNKVNGIKCDQIVRLKNEKVLNSYPEPIRRIKYFDQELSRNFVFITNNFDMPAEDIATLYKYRWKIELFFKWIKQHLKIKTFWGYSLNAVKTQVYVAIITYMVISIIKSKLKIKRSQYEILQILSISLLCKTPLNDLLKDVEIDELEVVDSNQLNIFEL
jgi:hypothetical protein